MFKRVFVTSLFATLALFSADTFAQHTSPGQNTNAAGRIEGPKKIFGSMDGSNWLFNRILSLDLTRKFSEMEKAGVTERTYIADFGISGALFFDKEIRNSDWSNDWSKYVKSGKGVGVEIGTFKLHIDDQKRKYFAMSAVALRNMNTFSESDAAGDFVNSDLWGLIDNVDLFLLKWDDEYTYNGIKTFSAEVLRAELKQPLAHGKNFNVAVIAAGNIGWSLDQYKGEGYEFSRKRTKKTYETSTYYSDLRIGEEKRGAFHAAVRPGLEFNFQTDKGFRVQLKAQLEAAWTKQNKIFDQGKENRTGEFAKHVAEFDVWYDQHAAELSNVKNEAQYLAIVKNNMYPIYRAYTDDLIHRSLYFTPSLEISQRLKVKGAKEGKAEKPAPRIGLSVQSTQSVWKGDVLSTKQNGRFDVSDQLRNRGSLKLFLSF